MRIAPVILLAGCYTSSPTAPTLSNTVKAEPEELSVRTSSVGPIHGDTEATLVHLRELLAGYEVKPSHDGSLQYDVYKNGEMLFYVVPDQEQGTIFNVHVVSGKIAVAGKSWRVGAPFSGAASLTSCECWGDNPTCFIAGEHVAVNFNRTCDDVTEDPAARRSLEGMKIQRVIWNPLPFGNDPDEETRD
ncbi:MAG: hypothetical protein HOV81_37075 [Kofleriaceae bacterium]|nr:hypothetical protein [Kofleriaceae bacterium]